MEIKNALYLKTTEVTIEDWMGFIVSNDYDSSLFPAVLSPTLKIIFEELRTRQFRYLKLEKYSDYYQREFGKWKVSLTKASRELIEADSNYFALNLPVTGISYEQAMAFCKWKESTVNKYRSENKKIKVTLPSKQIYQEVIENIDSFCTGKCNDCNKYLLNYKVPECKLQEPDKATRTQGRSVIRSDAYWPNKRGFYNLQGNAAEITAEKGIAMGGSFNHTARESYNDQVQLYDKPEAWLGFRYVVTLVKTE